MAQPTSYDPNIIEIKSKVSAGNVRPPNYASCLRCTIITAIHTHGVLSTFLSTGIRDTTTVALSPEWTA